MVSCSLTDNNIQNLKLQANNLYAEGSFNEAIEIYNRILEIVAIHDDITATIYCNRAACHLKLGHYSLVIDDCSKCLNLTPCNTKALFRRSQAYENSSSFDKAYNDLEQILKIDPNNKALQESLQRVHQILKKSYSDKANPCSVIKSLIEQLKNNNFIDVNNKYIYEAYKKLEDLCSDSGAIDAIYRSNTICLSFELIGLIENLDGFYKIIKVIRILLNTLPIDKSIKFLEELTIDRLNLILQYAIKNGNEFLIDEVCHIGVIALKKLSHNVLLNNKIDHNDPKKISYTQKNKRKEILVNILDNVFVNGFMYIIVKTSLNIPIKDINTRLRLIRHLITTIQIDDCISDIALKYDVPKSISLLASKYTTDSAVPWGLNPKVASCLSLALFYFFSNISTNEKYYAFAIEQYCTIIDKLIENSKVEANKDTLYSSIISMVLILMDTSGSMGDILICRKESSFIDDITNICSTQITTHIKAHISNDNQAYDFADVGLPEISNIAECSRACEVIILLTSSKKYCTYIKSTGCGYDSLKLLFNHSNIYFKVAGLTGLSKIASSGGYGEMEKFVHEHKSNLKKTELILTRISEYNKNVQGKGLQMGIIPNVNGQLIFIVQKWLFESLSFLSISPDFKEIFSSNEKCLANLILLVNTFLENISPGCSINDSTCETNLSSNSSLILALCTTFANLMSCNLTKKMREEVEENKEQLKNLAKMAHQNIPSEHQYENSDYIKKRTIRLIDSGIIPVLSLLSKRTCSIETDNSLKLLSSRCRKMIANLYLAVSENKEYHRSIMQYNGVKSLLMLSNQFKTNAFNNTFTDVESISDDHVYEDSNDPWGYLTASQALSRLAIHFNPLIGFERTQLIESIRPLIKLAHFKNTSLQRFEAFMALTNIFAVSHETIDIFITSIDDSFNTIETGLFDQNILIRRAAMECTTNLLVYPQIVKTFFTPKEKISENIDDRCYERLKIVVLLSGEFEADEPTACAASGGLATLLDSYPNLIEYVLNVKSLFEILGELILYSKPSLTHRTLSIIQSIIKYDNNKYAEKVAGSPLLDLILALDVKVHKLKCDPNVKSDNTDAQASFDIASLILSTFQKIGLIKLNK